MKKIIPYFLILSFMLGGYLASFNYPSVFAGEDPYGFMDERKSKTTLEELEKVISELDSRVQLLERELGLRKHQDILDTYTPQYAEFIGTIEEKQGKAWFRVETEYTVLYFHNKAVTMEWVKDDVDEIFEYLLAFRDVEWDGKKVQVFFLDDAEVLRLDNNYYSSAYNQKDNYITMAATYLFEYLPDLDHKREDPRPTLLHELSHAIHLPKLKGGVALPDMWLDEGLANYLSIIYDYEPIDEEKFPEEANLRRNFDTLVLDDFDNEILGLTIYQTGDSFRYANEYISSQVAREIFTFTGLMKKHYNLDQEFVRVNISLKYFEASIIEFLIKEYGEEKLIQVYEEFHKQGDEYNLQQIFYRVYGLGVGEIEPRWIEYIHGKGESEELLETSNKE